MRTAIWSAGLLAVVGFGATAVAQGPALDGPAVETHSQAPVAVFRPYREETSSMTQRLIHERAAYRARQRQARLESQRWLGISSARPMLSQDRFCTEQNPIYAGCQLWGFAPETRSPWAR
jgi:hypothetical protein